MYRHLSLLKSQK